MVYSIGRHCVSLLLFFVAKGGYCLIKLGQDRMATECNTFDLDLIADSRVMYGTARCEREYWKGVPIAVLWLDAIMLLSTACSFLVATISMSFTRRMIDRELFLRHFHMVQ